jgi:hypothetical protein
MLKKFSISVLILAIVAAIAVLFAGSSHSANASTSPPPNCVVLSGLSPAPAAVRSPTSRITAATDVIQTLQTSCGPATVETKTSAAVAYSGTITGTAVDSAGATTASTGTASTTSSLPATCGNWSKTASQTYSSALWGIAGHTSHSWKWYYNCRYAWIHNRFSWDTGGFHRCGGGWAIGVSVNVEECSKTNDPALYPADTKTYYRFKVSALFNGFPVAFTKYMQSCSSARGGSWSCP